MWLSWCTGDLVQLGDSTALLFNHPKEVRSTVSTILLINLKIVLFMLLIVIQSKHMFMDVVEEDANTVSAHCHTIICYFLLSELSYGNLSAVSISLLKKVG